MLSGPVPEPFAERSVGPFARRTPPLERDQPLKPPEHLAPKPQQPAVPAPASALPPARTGACRRKPWSRPPTPAPESANAPPPPGESKSPPVGLGPQAEP